MSAYILHLSMEESLLDMRQVVVCAVFIVGPTGQEIFPKSLENSTHPKRLLKDCSKPQRVASLLLDGNGLGVLRSKNFAYQVVNRR